MAEHPAAPLLAADLGRLQHTNARGEVGYVHMPGFVNTAGMSEDQAGEAGILALAIAEATIETLERKHGYRVISETNLKAIATAGPNKPDDVVVHCNKCLQPVFELDISGNARVHVGMLADGLAAHAEVCR